MIYTIHIVQPPNKDVRCFIEVARALAYSLHELGHEVYEPQVVGDRIENPPFQGRAIVFAPNLLTPDYPIPYDAILYHLEQIPSTDFKLALWAGSYFAKLALSHEVWDYSVANLEKFNRLGAKNVKLCRVGYSPCLETIPKVEEDIDVLHYGAMTPGHRRMRLLEVLDGYPLSNGKPLKLEHVMSAYGAERDALIARSKVVVCVHYNEPKNAIWEVVRCSYLLTNKKCVVSEKGGQDNELEALASASTIHVPYGEMVEACVQMVNDSNLRRKYEQVGYDVMKQFNQTDEVKKALS